MECEKLFCKTNLKLKLIKTKLYDLLLFINYVESPNSNLKFLWFYSYINAFTKFLKIDTVSSKSISCSSQYLCTLSSQVIIFLTLRSWLTYQIFTRRWQSITWPFLLKLLFVIRVHWLEFPEISSVCFSDIHFDTI